MKFNRKQHEENIKALSKATDHFSTKDLEYMWENQIIRPSEAIEAIEKIRAMLETKLKSFIKKV